MTHYKIPPILRGDGGPGTIYSSVGYYEAVARHGLPNGVWSKERVLPYGVSDEERWRQQGND